MELCESNKNGNNKQKKLSQLATILKQIDDAITKLSDTGDDDLCKVQTFDDQGLKHTAQAKKSAERF